MAALCDLLPLRAAEALGAVIGGLGYALGIRRDVVVDQLSRAFPERSDEWVRDTARASFKHLGRETIAMLRMRHLTREEMVSIAGETNGSQVEHLRENIDAGRGAVIATAHFGNWEVAGGSLAARGVPLDVVVVKQANRLFNAEIVRTRERLGMRVIYKRDAPRRALAALREGRAVAFVSDQDARQAGVFVPFFGRPASTPRGPALMAVRTGAPLYVGYAKRLGPGRYIGAIEHVDVPRNGDVDDVVEKLTAAFTAKLEELIRENPEQYLWQHRRWKTAPPTGN